MKGRIAIVLILVLAAAFVGRRVAWHSQMSASGEARDEKHENFRLVPGAQIEVQGINGPVEVATSDTDAADVRIVRTAASQEDLDGQRIIVEHTPTSLVVRGERTHRSFWSWLHGGSGEVRQQVWLALPRRVDVTTHGVNGPVSIGAVDGSLDINGINGRVEAAPATGRCTVGGVNGGVKLGVAQLGAQGLDLHGINGPVELRVADGLNADVNVHGLNGNVTFNIPGVTAQERDGRSNLHARLGTGGAPINISGVNGGVRFEPIARQ